MLKKAKRWRHCQFFIACDAKGKLDYLAFIWMFGILLELIKRNLSKKKKD